MFGFDRGARLSQSQLDEEQRLADHDELMKGELIKFPEAHKPSPPEKKRRPDGLGKKLKKVLVPDLPARVFRESAPTFRELA